MASEDLGGLESLQVLLQQNPNSLTFGRVADALLKLGRVDEAIQLCEDGLRRHPSYVTGHMVLGKCYLKKKLFDQAEKEFKRVLLFDPKYLAAHKYYGDLMREIGWDNTCEMSYRKILQIDPLDKGVRAVIEELAQKVKMEKLEPAPIRREAKPAVEPPLPPPIPVQPMTPMQSEDFFTSPDMEENDLLRYQSAAEADGVPFDMGMPPEQTSSSEPRPAIPPVPDADDERFSYILDDIFQDEVLDEKPATPVPTSKTPLPPANNRLEARREEELDDRDATRFVPPSNSRNDTGARRPEENNRMLGADSDGAEPPARRIPTRPVDFELDSDEAPPPARTGPDQSSGFDLEALTPDENKTPARPNSRTTASSRLPARRPKIFEDHGNDEPAAMSTPGEREKIVTPTLGEIYAAQGQYTKAIGVFELLSKKEPNNKHYREKIDYLKKRLQETQNAG